MCGYTIQFRWNARAVRKETTLPRRHGLYDLVRTTCMITCSFYTSSLATVSPASKEINLGERAQTTTSY